MTDFMSRNVEEDIAEDKTSLAFGSGWTAFGCIDPIYIIDRLVGLVVTMSDY